MITLDVLPTIKHEFVVLMTMIYGKDFKTKLPDNQLKELFKTFCAGWLASTSIYHQSTAESLETILKSDL